MINKSSLGHLFFLSAEDRDKFPFEEMQAGEGRRKGKGT